jgi:NAD(P)-dependent dehydrogenase (short-subunit alcohol dehydrogenase family)
MGLDIARYALATGHAVVATGRDSAAVDRFGRIDVLVNDAVRLYAGYFEELTPDQVERQLTTSLIGPMADNPAIRRTSRAHSSRSPVRSRRRAASSPAPMRSPSRRWMVAVA